LQCAGAGGDANLHPLADMFVILVQRVVAVAEEMQQWRGHDDEIGADRLGVVGKFQHRVHVLAGARHDGAGAATQRIGSDIEVAFASGQRHREKLALLAGDEHAVDTERPGPVQQVAAKAGVVERQILGAEWRQGGGPDTTQMRARRPWRRCGGRPASRPSPIGATAPA